MEYKFNVYEGRKTYILPGVWMMLWFRLKIKFRIFVINSQFLKKYSLFIFYI